MGPAAVPVLVKALKDDSWQVRCSAAQALGKMGPAAVPALVEALKDKDLAVRYCCARELGEMGPAAAAAVPALVEALKDKHWTVRCCCAQALGEMGPAAVAAVPALVKVLKDDHWYVRHFSAQALGKMGPAAGGGGAAAAVPALVKALKDVRREVRVAAANALGEMGSAAAAAVPAIAEDLGTREPAAEDCDVFLMDVLARKPLASRAALPYLEKLPARYYKHSRPFLLQLALLHSDFDRKPWLSPSLADAVKDAALRGNDRDLQLPCPRPSQILKSSMSLSRMPSPQWMTRWCDASFASCKAQAPAAPSPLN